MDIRTELFQAMVKEIDISYELISDYDSRTRSYGSEKLFQAESYMVKDIGDAPGITLTELSKIEKKTKGACSKILRKLIERGLVVQERNEDNLREYFLTLTELGEQVYISHRKLNEYYSNRAQKMLECFSDDELRTFIAIQKQLNVCYLADNYDDIHSAEMDECV